MLTYQTRLKVLSPRGYNSPQKRNLGFCRQHSATVATPTIRVIKCKLSPVYGVYFYIPLLIARKHELGLPCLPRNLAIKSGRNPSTIFLFIVVTGRNTQTDTQTNAGKNTLPRFRGEDNVHIRLLLYYRQRHCNSFFTVHSVKTINNG